MSYTAVDLIATKRDGGVLDEDAIAWLIDAYTSGNVTDYQMSAMAMAIFFNGLNEEELASWTSAMLNSGDVLDFSDIAAPKLDKHSTGGVGDKISIPLAPLVASCGIAVPMISGRSLGHTGGTLDKLESIPGFVTELDRHRFRSILEEHGLVLAGASESIVPADRKLYGLRDATATVPSLPLISSSIMSKKLAEGLDGLVLDVKTGTGALMKTLDKSEGLAREMVGIGKAHGVRTVAFITNMDQPLGREVGNANEIKESVSVLRGEGPEDVTELTMVLGEAMLDIAGIEGGRDRLEAGIRDGSALEKLMQVTAAHGGDPSVLEDPSLLDQAPHEVVVTAPRSGYVTRCDALAIGLSATSIGAGRGKTDDTVDPGVGITVEAKVGDLVETGQPLARVRYRNANRWDEQRERLTSAWVIEDESVDSPPLVFARVD